MMAARLGQQTRATVALGLSRRRRGTAAGATDSATKQELGARPKPGWDNASMDGAWSADAQWILNDLQEKVTARDLPALLQLFEDPAVLIGTAGDGRTPAAREAYLEAVTTHAAALRWDWRETLPSSNPRMPLVSLRSATSCSSRTPRSDERRSVRPSSRCARTVAGDCGSSTDRSRNRRTKRVPRIPSAMRAPDTSCGRWDPSLWRRLRTRMCPPCTALRHAVDVPAVIYAQDGHAGWSQLGHHSPGTSIDHARFHVRPLQPAAVL
jgi:hypothetical protein